MMTSTVMKNPVPGNNDKADGRPYSSGPGAVGCLGMPTTAVGRGSSQLNTSICLPSEQDESALLMSQQRASIYSGHGTLLQMNISLDFLE